MLQFLVLFISVTINMAHAQTSFLHAFSEYSGHLDNPFGRQAVFQSRNDTRASASLKCRETLANSVAIETIGKWVNLPNENFNYQGSYICRPVGKKLKRITSEILFANNLQCVWKGEAMSNLMAEDICREKFGTSSNGKLYGGCIGGQQKNIYVFETFCQ